MVENVKIQGCQDEGIRLQGVQIRWRIQTQFEHVQYTDSVQFNCSGIVAQVEYIQLITQLRIAKCDATIAEQAGIKMDVHIVSTQSRGQRIRQPGDLQADLQSILGLNGHRKSQTDRRLSPARQ